jgi:hypothetical protein
VHNKRRNIKAMRDRGPGRERERERARDGKRMPGV